MVDFREIVACTGNFKGKEYIGIACEGGEVVVIYEDGTSYCYSPNNFELLKELIEHSCVTRVFYSHKDFHIAINNKEVNCNEKLQLILDKIDYIKDALEGNITQFNDSNAVIKNIDALGRITIPKAIRRKFGIEDGAAAKVYELNNKIIIEIVKE